MTRRRSGGQRDQRGDAVSEHGHVSVRDRTVGLPAPFFCGPLEMLTGG
jgi:hypothetical protein